MTGPEPRTAPVERDAEAGPGGSSETSGSAEGSTRPWASGGGETTDRSDGRESPAEAELRAVRTETAPRSTEPPGSGPPGNGPPTAGPAPGTRPPGAAPGWGPTPDRAADQPPAAPVHAAPTAPVAQPPPVAPSFAPRTGPAGAGVPARAAPLPPPRPTAPSGQLPPRVPARPAVAGTPAGRPAARGRRARLTLRRIDPWSVFLYAVVASIFLGLALLVCVAALYAVLSNMGVLDSVNTLIGDVTTAPGETAEPSTALTAGRVLGVTAVIAALNVVLLTALATMGAFLYNLCAAMTGGIELTFGDRE